MISFKHILITFTFFSVAIWVMPVNSAMSAEEMRGMT